MPDETQQIIPKASHAIINFPLKDIAFYTEKVDEL